MDRHLEELREKLFSSDIKCVKVDCFAFNDTYKNYCAMGGCIQLFLDAINIRIRSEKLKSKYKIHKEPKFKIGEQFYQFYITSFEHFLTLLKNKKLENLEKRLYEKFIVTEVRFNSFDESPEYFSQNSHHNEEEMFKTKEEVIKKTLDMLFTESRDSLNKLEKESNLIMKARDLILELEEKFLNKGE